MTIRDLLKDRFEPLKIAGSQAKFMDQAVESMDRDEILALIGLMGEKELFRRPLYAGHAVGDNVNIHNALQGVR